MRSHRLTALILVLAGHANAGATVDAPPEPGFFNISDERASMSSRPDSPFYQDKERGWFWYEPEPVWEDAGNEAPLPTTETKQPPAPPRAKPQSTSPAPLSSAWFRNHLTHYRDLAVDNPSPENVARYLYLQRVMLDKAERFSAASQQLVMADAVLDENSRRPLSTFAATAMDDHVQINEDQAVKQLAQDVGVWFFYESTCTFCLKEAGVLKGLTHAYGFKVLPIALDGLPLPDNTYPDFTIDRGQARQLGVDVTPALFLVKPGQNGGVLQLAQGLLAGDEIVKRALVLSHEKGWISDAVYHHTLKAKPITVDASVLQNLQESDIQTPHALVDAIKANLRKQLSGVER